MEGGGRLGTEEEKELPLTRCWVISGECVSGMWAWLQREEGGGRNQRSRLLTNRKEDEETSQ